MEETKFGELATQVSLRKSLWKLILSRLSAWREDLNSALSSPTGADSVTFSISFIALAAKLAKADGLVTRDEVSMFRMIFTIPGHEEKNAARVYDLCRQDTTGFESYARKMHRALGASPEADRIRIDVLDGLFHIAMADGEFHPAEEEFLRVVADVFSIDQADFDVMMARHVPDYENPFLVLGVTPDAQESEIKSAWRQLVRDNHPDLLISRGLPEEMIQLANGRMSSINKAYEQVSALRKQPENHSAPYFDGP